VQRLFTTFANGWPGLGLLIQRLVIGALLVHGAVRVFSESSKAATIAPDAAGAVLAIFIVLGLWTPVVGALLSPIEVWAMHDLPSNSSYAILLAVLGATLAMIGPGAFSVDAQLFGRKQIGG
jgi:putative oxidoreductase